MSHSSDVLEIQAQGSEGVARFQSLDFPSESVLERCYRELDTFLENHNCELLTFDLDGVPIIPSTMLGLLLVYRQRGFRVRILNPSEHVVAVLKVTKLASSFDVEPAIKMS